MFDWFRTYNRPQGNIASDMKQITDDMHKVIPALKPQSMVAYQVGKTEDGQVTLSLGDYNATVVTMTNAGVDTLIRMLEAAKESEETSA